MCTYIYICVHVYMYIRIYKIQKEREGDCVYLHVESGTSVSTHRWYLGGSHSITKQQSQGLLRVCVLSMACFRLGDVKELHSMRH